MITKAFILIITINIIQLERKHILFKEDIWIEFYPIHGQKPKLNKLKRFSESYWRQRILLNIQINNWNPVLKQSSLSWSEARLRERVLGQRSVLLCLAARHPPWRARWNIPWSYLQTHCQHPLRKGKYSLLNGQALKTNPKVSWEIWSDTQTTISIIPKQPVSKARGGRVPRTEGHGTVGLRAGGSPERRGSRRWASKRTWHPQPSFQDMLHVEATQLSLWEIRHLLCHTVNRVLPNLQAADTLLKPGERMVAAVAQRWEPYWLTVNSSLNRSPDFPRSSVKN